MECIRTGFILTLNGAAVLKYLTLAVLARLDALALVVQCHSLWAEERVVRVQKHIVEVQTSVPFLPLGKPE